MINIILPTDFSENSKHAIRYARELFKGEACTFYLVNSYETPHAGAGMLVSIVDVLKKESEKDLNEFYDSLVNEGLNEGVKFNLVSEHGSLVSVIERLHKRYVIDLVIMGTKGAGGLREVLIGSNTADVIKSGVCASLAIPEQAKISKPSKIVFASDNKVFNENKTFEGLNYIAQKHDAEVLVLNVENGSDEVMIGSSFNETFSKLINETKHTYHTVESDAVEHGISSFVANENADMLAMVSRKIGFFESLFHKSMTKEMAMHVSVPLLVMHD